MALEELRLDLSCAYAAMVPFTEHPKLVPHSDSDIQMFQKLTYSTMFTMCEVSEKMASTSNLFCEGSSYLHQSSEGCALELALGSHCRFPSAPESSSSFPRCHACIEALHLDAWSVRCHRMNIEEAHGANSREANLGISQRQEEFRETSPALLNESVACHKALKHLGLLP
eukprot:4366670-Amphidinium_carterae.1